jgi:hypothetical protein
MEFLEGGAGIPWWFIIVFVLILLLNITRLLHRRGYINVPCFGRQNGSFRFHQGQAQPAVAIELGAPGAAAAAPPVSQFLVNNNNNNGTSNKPPTYNYYGQQPPPPVAPAYGVAAPPPPPAAPTAQHPAVTYASQQHPAVTYAYAEASPVLGQAPDLGPGGYSG